MIIGISGRKQSGKTTIGKFLVEQLDGARSIDFADELKRICQGMFGATHLQVYGSDTDKNTLVKCGLSARELMQTVGSSMRAVWPDCWVNAWARSVKAHWAVWGVCPVITADVRYPNEVAKIHEMGGIVLRLRRGGIADGHESETALDEVYGRTHREGNGVYFDAVIEPCSEEEACVLALRIAREQGIT